MVEKSLKEKQKPPGQDLAITFTVLVYGIMFHYFPIYAGIIEPWSYVFIVIAYLCYIASLFGAVTGLDQLTKSEFIKNFGFGFAFIMITFFMHKWSNTISAHWLALTIKIVMLPIAMIGVVGIFTAFPYLWVPYKKVVTHTGNLNNNSEKYPKEKTTSELALSLIIAILSFLSALSPIYLRYLNNWLGWNL